MTYYDFTLKYRLSTASENPETHLSALAVSGCDDATIGLGKPGFIALSFSREAQNLNQALQSACSDVQQAIPNACLIEANTENADLHAAHKPQHNFAKPLPLVS